ncbi:hypothetical protein B0T18DRAFT_395150 [Schizothecium vesticola]|uniref:Nephrocystin 3-like N-terminal domain-containing protein n=1 Tax=Schizothecium vesticola TaxID=314040 RepID=A0AA40BRG0_9PEZI|nr:hypothetical protein B0T18DRAFT_395150 [Schizothecium vesticola]
MDPASALGTTSAVLTFLSCVGKTIKLAHQLHNAKETPLEFERLDKLSASLHSGLSKLKQALASKKPNNVSASESSLLNVLEQNFSIMADNPKTDIIAKLDVLSEQSNRNTTAIQDSIKNWDDWNVQVDLQLAANHSELLSKIESIQKQLATSCEILQTTSHRLILEGIAFPDIDARLGHIEDQGQAEGTFEWLIKDDKIPESQQGALVMSFRQWLSDDSQGIFHIAGKPGSGKSTLMRFLKEHPETRAQLRKWAAEGGDETEPVVAAVFFWNAGSRSQKSMNGLYRTLLHSILESHHKDLIPLLFPDRLVNSNPKRVKMCVSSREEEPWLDHFNNYPRLTVHLTTDPDIETMIRNAIGEHPNFEVFEPWKARWFIDHFVQIAEGVFLWAKLILVDVVAMLDYKKGLRDLRQALESYPPELDGLFEKIMRDKVRNNEEALTILKIMIELREDTIVRDHDLIASEFVIRQYSLVGDALSGKIQCRNQWPKEGAWEEEQERVGKFIANLPLLFGGLVTLTSDDYSIETLNFSHRSVYQYLVGNLQYNSLDEAKIRATALQCLVAGMRVYESGCGRYDQFYDEDVYFTKAVLQWIVKSDEITQEICFPWLEEMEQHFVRLSDDINVSEKDSNPKSKLDLEARRGPCWILVLSACYDLASYMEWALSRSTCTSQWITTTQAQAATLDYLIFIWFDCDSFRVFAGDLLRSLRVFLLEKADRQWTIDSNAVVSTRSCGQVSIWQYFIIRMTMNAGILGLYPEIWDAVGVFLEYDFP